MRDQLFTLWDNFEIYKFLKGYEWIDKREQEICECLTKDEQEVFIETNRCDWILAEYKD
jgi:hypothetical protein